MGGERTVVPADHEERRAGTPPRRLRKFEKRIRLSAIFLILGLLVEAFSLRWAHPTAFVVFVGIGGLLIAAGLLVFLYAMLASWQRAASES